jgi:hypothetical protein
MLLGLSADIWLYGVCLAIGILLSLPSAVGRTARAGHLPHAARPGHLPAVRHGHASHASHASHTHHISARPALPRYSLLNPVALATFLGGFGAVGLIGRGAGAARWLAMVLALSAGLLISAALFRLFVRYVLAAEGSSPSAREEAIGKIASVSTIIPAVGLGSITYVANGRRHTVAARTADDQTLPRGCEVVVIAVANNIAEVVRYDER